MPTIHYCKDNNWNYSVREITTSLEDVETYRTFTVPQSEYDYIQNCTTEELKNKVKSILEFKEKQI